MSSGVVIAILAIGATCLLPFVAIGFQLWREGSAPKD